MISHIVAAAENDVIGFQNDLLWDIPEDMNFFRKKTQGKIIIMGRKTFESLGVPLLNRLNIIVTRRKDYKPDGGFVFSSIEKAIEFAKSQAVIQKEQYGDEIFIIGGGEIYSQTIGIVDKIYLTRIHKSFEGDTHYPKVLLKDFKEIEKIDRSEPIPFSFLTFQRVSNFTK